MSFLKNKILRLTHALLYGFFPYLSAQDVKNTNTASDTIRYKPLNISVFQNSTSDLLQLSGQALNGATFSTINLSGHSVQQIEVAEKSFHVAEKTGRQLFSEIPGAMIYDMDGSGNQVNLAIRGLDPHRSWEFNIRQNGIVTNSDMYGYPASHYSMPLEAVQSIEIIKGTAALQYGAQFGGMINYTLKSPSPKKIHYEGQHNVGSFGLLSTYHSLNGTLGKVNYFSYIQYRQSNGYRQNGESQASAFHSRITYQPSSKLSVTAEISNSQYLYQLPGPLELEQFINNPRQSTRTRNYFQPNIYIPGVTMMFRPNDKTTVTLITSAVLGHRNSVLFEGFANKLDTINVLTQTYANRTVDIDEFRSYTSELRLKQLFRIANVSNSLTAGIRAFNNVLWRRQLGRGTTGSDFDLSVEPNSFKRDLKFHSQSIALSVENAIYINSRWSVSPGFRYEVGQTNAYGSINYINADSIPRIIEHQLPAFGLATKYKPKGSNSVFIAGISQAHRPVIFKDIIPGSALERAAHDLKNATGYNAELSYNNFIWKDIITPNKSRNFNYTLSLYQTQYNNRMGNWVLFDSLSSNNYIQKTNIGNSRTRGLECLFKYTVIDHKKNRKLDITNATAIQQAKYTKATAVSAGKNVSIAGNSVEGVPTLISRTSIGFQNNKLYLSVLYSYVSAQFSDALNTVNISANGSVGKVPAYGIIDIQGVYQLHPTAKIRFGLNNLLNKSYYSKRPTMYPGPGIWPSDGRGFNLGIELTF
jgi:Fe(3+) dicitrate transport protein